MPCGRNRLVNVRLGVRGGNEESFVLATRKVDAALDEAPKESGKTPGVAARGNVPVGYKVGIEKECKHAPHAGQHVRHSGARRGGNKAGSKSCASLFKLGVRRPVAQLLE